MSDYLPWYGVTILLWGTCWGLLCLIFCSGSLWRAPRQLGVAALACALRFGIAVSPPWHFWARLLSIRLPAAWVNPFYHPVDATHEVLALLLLSGLVYGLRWVTPAEVGLRGLRPGSGQPVGLVVAAGAAIVGLNAYLGRQGLPDFWWSGRLFLAILPGLAEELFYRGVLLTLLSRVFARRLPLPGTHTSWGGGVGIILFMLAHGLKCPAYQMALVPAATHHVSWQGWYYWLPLWHSSAAAQCYYLAMGTLFLWVRERTGSVWAAVGTHCLMNTSLLLGASLS